MTRDRGPVICDSADGEGRQLAWLFQETVGSTPTAAFLRMYTPAAAIGIMKDGFGIDVLPSGPILPEGQIGVVEILRQEWVRPRAQDFAFDAIACEERVKPRYIAIGSNNGVLLLAQVERHTYPDHVEILRTLVEIQELNEAS